ncbi:MAG: hypothetical protein ACI85I_000532 [Arenicella sp.]|jgi:hypothetical protein
MMTNNPITAQVVACADFSMLGQAVLTADLATILFLHQVLLYLLLLEILVETEK